MIKLFIILISISQIYLNIFTFFHHHHFNASYLFLLLYLDDKIHFLQGSQRA
jgi:hypothetical protein